MQALFTLLQPNHLRTAKPTVIFLEGPPGTGKSTTLYWTYIQCKHMASWHPVAIPLLNMDDATTQQAIVCTMQKKGGNQQIIGLVDLMRPYELTSRAYSAFCSRVLPSVSLIVFAASLSYAVYQATECGTRFLPLYQRALTIQTRPFSTALAAEYWRAHTSCSSEVNLQKDIAVSKGIPRLLNLLCTAAHLEKAVKLAVVSEFNQLFVCMQHSVEAVDWEGELKVMLAAAKKLPISVYGMQTQVATNLFMVKSFLIYLNDQDIPMCYFTIPEDTFQEVTRRLWKTAPISIRTCSNATIGDLFENSLPSVILPKLSVTLRCLGDDQQNREHTFEFEEVVGLYSDPSHVTQNRLYQTESTFRALDFVAITALEGKPYLVALQVSVQQANAAAKLQALTRIPAALTNEVIGVFFILINPFWTNFDEMYAVARSVTGDRQKFATYWYGHPKDFTRIKALHKYVKSILL